MDDINMNHNNMNSQKYLQKMHCAYPLNLDDCPRLKVAIPQKGDYHICYYEETDIGFLALFRIGITSKEDISAWKSQFQESSLATWRVARTHPQKQRNTQFRIDYRCQHKTRHLEDKYISKNTNCDASMVIRAHRTTPAPERIVADTTKQDRKGNTAIDIERESEHSRLSTIISLVFEHNHSISTASALRFRDVPKELEEKFYSLFMRGLTVKEALQYHTDAIKSVTPEADWKYALVDRAKVPDKSWCYKIFTKVRKLNPDMKKRKQLSLLKISHRPPPSCDPPPQPLDTAVRMEQIQHLQPQQILSPQDPQQQTDNLLPPKSGEELEETAEKFDFVVYDSTPKPEDGGGMITLAELSVSAACSNYSPLQRKMLDTYAVGEEEHSKDKLYLTLHRTKRGKVEKVRRSCRPHQQFGDGDTPIVVSVLYEGDREGYFYDYKFKDGYNPAVDGSTQQQQQQAIDEENVEPMTQVNITVDSITGIIGGEKTSNDVTTVGEKPTDDDDDDDVIMTVVHPLPQEEKNDEEVKVTPSPSSSDVGELQMACC